MLHLRKFLPNSFQIPSKFPLNAGFCRSLTPVIFPSKELSLETDQFLLTLNMQSLFPTPAARGAAQAPSLLQFNAGKCVLTPQTNGKFMVSADPRRGQIQLTKGIDGILHFKWVNLVNGNVEDDRMVMGGDCSFKRVKTGRENVKDRVYMLKFAGNSKPLMYWMQDVENTKDEENVKKTNDLLTYPASGVAPTGAAAGALGAAGGLGALSGLGGVPGAAGANWMQNWGNGGTPTPAPAAAASTGAPAVPFGNLDLSSLLGTLNNNAAAASRPPAVPSAPRVPPTPSLQNIVQADEIVRSGVLSDPSVQAELLPHLPAEQQTAEHLESTLRSPQLQQSLGSLTNALRNPDNLQSVMSNFNLDPAAGQDHLIRGDGVGAFLAAVQSGEDSSTANNTTNTNPGEEKKDENAMDES